MYICNVYVFVTINLYNVDGFRSRRTSHKKNQDVLVKAVAKLEKHGHSFDPIFFLTAHSCGSGSISSWFRNTRQRLSGRA